MSNGYFLADTNSLVFAYRSGGSELLDEYRKIATSQHREFAITRIIEREILDGPLTKELGQYLADRNIPVLPAPDTEQRLRAGTLPRISSGDASMLEVAARESDSGRVTRIWADDKYFDSDQIMRKHPDAHRTMSSELLDEAYEQKFISAEEHQKYRAAYQQQGAFIDSPRLNSFRYEFSTPEVESPSPHMRGLKLGVAAEIGLTAAEWTQTHRLAQAFKHTLHNDTAAVDAYVRQGAQTAGSVVGTTVGGVTATAVGAGSGGTFALVMADAYLFGKAAEHGVEAWQARRIYHVTDTQDVDWAFDGKQWVRDDLRGDLVADGRDLPQPHDFAAMPDKARELSAMASAEAVKQALAGVPTPRDPFVQSAGDGGEPWRYEPESGQWTRQVVTAYDVNDSPSAYETVEAQGDQRARLSAEASRVIDANLNAGPAVIAAEYQIGHRAYGYDQTPAGAMPEAVTTVLNSDLLQASDGRHYQRNAQGEWTHEGKAAAPERMLELELTRERLLPALQAHQQRLAQMPEWQPPTRDELDHTLLRGAYLRKGLDPDVRPEQFEASVLAMQRTRETTGVTGSPVLAADTNGTYSFDGSPIHHIARTPDGVVRIVAITTPEDIAKARAELRPQSQDEQAPKHTTPERTITPATPEERDAREQAQREANRPGLSQDEVQQAVAAPTRSMGGGKRDDGLREQDTPRDDAQQRRASNERADPGAATPTLPQSARATDPRDPDHPDHRLYKQIEAGVTRIDASTGRTFDATSERLTMGAFHDAKAAGMTSADHVVLNQTGAPQRDGSQTQGNTLLIAIQGQDPYDPAARRSVTDVKQAVEQPLEHSLQKAVALEQQQQTQTPQPDVPTPDTPGPKGPTR